MVTSGHGIIQDFDFRGICSKKYLGNSDPHKYLLRVKSPDCYTNISALIFFFLLQMVFDFCEISVLGDTSKMKALHVADE